MTDMMEKSRTHVFKFLSVEKIVNRHGFK